MLALVPILLGSQLFAASHRLGHSRNAAMSVVLFALPRYLLVALFCTAAYAIGNAILRRLEFACLPERLTICSALGLGLLSHVVLLMGISGWLTPIGVIGGIIALGSLVMLIPRKPGRAVETARSFPRFSRLTWSLLALGLVTTMVLLWPLLLLPLYPPTDFDETMAHLAVPKMWLTARAVIVTPFFAQSNSTPIGANPLCGLDARER